MLCEDMASRCGSSSAPSVVQLRARAGLSFALSRPSSWLSDSRSNGNGDLTDRLGRCELLSVASAHKRFDLDANQHVDTKVRGANEVQPLRSDDSETSQASQKEQLLLKSDGETLVLGAKSSSTRNVKMGQPPPDGAISARSSQLLLLLRSVRRSTPRHER